MDNIFILSIIVFFFFFSYFLTWLSIPLAKKIKIIDECAEHKIHLKPTTCFGGIGIVISFLSFLFLNNFFLKLNPTALFPSEKCIFLISGLSTLLVLGFFDDKFGFSAKIKLPVQIFVTILFISGEFITSLNLVSNQTINNYINLFITFFWFLTMINAFNIIDGLDGLAGGISSIIVFFLIVFDLFILKTNNWVQLLVLLSCILGFLLHNQYPAKTFMGDTGSTFLGAIIAIYTLKLGIAGRVSAIALIPVILLLYPFFDTFFSLVRRTFNFLNNRIENGKSITQYLNFIFKGDRKHIHHKLLELNGSHKKTVYLLLLINFLLGVISFAFFYSNLYIKLTVLLFLAFGIFLLLRKLGYIPKMWSIRKSERSLKSMAEKRIIK